MRWPCCRNVHLAFNRFLVCWFSTKPICNEELSLNKGDNCIKYNYDYLFRSARENAGTKGKKRGKLEPWIPESEWGSHGEEERITAGNISETVLNGKFVPGVSGIAAVGKWVRLSQMRKPAWIPATQRTGISAPNAATRFPWRQGQCYIRPICRWWSGFWPSIWCARINAGFRQSNSPASWGRPIRLPGVCSSESAQLWASGTGSISLTAW